MKIYCSCCAKQVVKEQCNRYDRLVTTNVGAKTSGSPNEVICGFCAEDLDENGNFPEEVC